jgi:hypothetical protein
MCSSASSVLCNFLSQVIFLPIFHPSSEVKEMSEGKARVKGKVGKWWRLASEDKGKQAGYNLMAMEEVEVILYMGRGRRMRSAEPRCG